MGKVFEELINRFDKGILNDPRDTNPAGFSYSAHFDLSNPHRLIPYRNTEANEDKTFAIKRFLYTNGKLYGLGEQAANDRPKIFEKASDPIADSWTASTSGEGSTGTSAATNVFFAYKNFLYGWRDNAAVFRYNIGTPGFTDSYQSIAYTYVAQPVHHPADDIAYFFSDNNTFNPFGE